jgi:hypothetical protein
MATTRIKAPMLHALSTPFRENEEKVGRVSFGLQLIRIVRFLKSWGAVRRRFRDGPVVLWVWTRKMGMLEEAGKTRADSASRLDR